SCRGDVTFRSRLRRANAPLPFPEGAVTVHSEGDTWRELGCAVRARSGRRVFRHDSDRRPICGHTAAPRKPVVRAKPKPVPRLRYESNDLAVAGSVANANSTAVPFNDIRRFSPGGNSTVICRYGSS